MSSICSHATNEDELLQQATSAVAGALYPDNCGFLLLDQQRNVLVTHPSFVLSDRSVSTSDKPLGTGITGHVAQTGRAVRTGDVRSDPNYLAADPRTLSELCIPLMIGDCVQGVLNIECSKPDAFSEIDEQLIRICCAVPHCRAISEATYFPIR